MLKGINVTRTQYTRYLFSFVETPHVNLLYCNNKFTWCFHKAKQVYCIHHANAQGT